MANPCRILDRTKRTIMKALWITCKERQREDRELLAGISGLCAEFALGAGDGLNQLQGSRFDVVVANFPIAEWTADELLEELHRVNALTPVIVRDVEGSLADAVRLTKLGAFEFLDGAATADVIYAALTQALEYGRSRELALLGDARLKG